MKKILYSFSIALMFLLASCDLGPKERNNLAYFNIDLANLNSQSKALVSTDNSAIALCQYQAIPLFEAENIVGFTTSWTDFNSSLGKSSIGPFSVGLWRFNFRALNSNNKCIAEGSTVQTLKSGNSSLIKIYLCTPETDIKGSLDINISLPENADTGLMEMTISNGNTNIKICDEDWTTKKNLTYKKTVSLNPGNYECIVKYYINNIVVGEQTLFVTVVSEEKSEIRGELNGDLKDPIGESETLNGTIGQEKTVCVGENAEFKFINTGLSKPTSFVWTIDGQIQESTTNSFTFLTNTKGKYLVCCTVSDNSNSFSSKAYLNVEEEEKVLTVTINPNEGVKNEKSFAYVVNGGTYSSLFAPDTIPTRTGYTLVGYEILEN